MSGAALLISGIAAGVGALGVGVSAYDGSKSSANQKQSLIQQTTATQTAEGNALSTERKNAVAANMATQQTPDVSTIMAQAAQAAKSGIGSTMLTGPGGVGTGTLGGGSGTLLGK
jgi:hypothetical protein